MTENNNLDLDGSSPFDEFDEQLRGTAHEMREQMRPTDEVLNETLAAAQLTPAIETTPPTQPSSTTETAPLESPEPFPAPRGMPVNPTPTKSKAKKHRLGRMFGIAAGAAVLMIGGIAGFNALSVSVLTPSNSGPAQSVVQSAAQEIFTPSSYDEVYASLEERAFSTSDTGLFTLDSAAPGTGSSNSGTTAAGPSTESAPLAASSDDSGEYSETNLQVEGVDEADIVKTDGKNIYSLSGSQIIVMSAKGTHTKELARIAIKVGTPQDMYISGDRLVVMSSDNGGFEGNYYGSSSNQISFVSIYDISDPSAPNFLNSFAQDGDLRTSRLVDDILYVVSVSTVYEDGCDPGDPRTFVPNIYDGFEEEGEDLDSSAQALSVEAIRILPEYSSAQYTVLAAIEVGEAKRSSELSLLGDTSTVYMNEKNLFLTAASYGYAEIMPLEEEGSISSKLRELPIFPWEVLSFIIDPDAWFERSSSQSTDMMSWDYSHPVTRITRLALGNGHPELAASTTVDGELLNQFSLDEYEGHLRVAITETKEVQDPEDARNSNSWVPTTTSNSLLVFDSDLAVVGSIEDMAPGEKIYSARFTGEVAYMVTFRQIDPLFSLDLSNPKNPQVMDALKIPGFSQYLHPYAEGLLLGLGMDTTNSGSLTNYLKLSMFDVSDPFDIQEANKQLVDAYTSDALTNHKAVLIDEKQNIIGFAVVAQKPSSGDEKERFQYETESRYMIYGYDDTQGFYERAAIELPDENKQTRALYIDGYLYVVNGKNVGVFSLDTLEEIIWVRM